MLLLPLVAHPPASSHVRQGLPADLWARTVGVGATVWAAVDDYAVWGMVDGKTPALLNVVLSDKEDAMDESALHHERYGRRLRVIECVVGADYTVSALR